MSVVRMARPSSSALSILRESMTAWGIPEQLLNDIVERQIVVSYAKGALVFGEGSTSDLFACVVSGYVKVYCPVGDGNRTLMRLAGPGEIIGYADYLDSKGQRARLFEAQALTKCEIGLITRDHVLRLLRDQTANFLLDAIQSLNTFWSQRTRWFATLVGLPFWERLAMVLDDLGSRVGVKDNRGVLLIPEISHEDLAEMIGCSRPMISRLLSEMGDAELIGRTQKQYVLLNKWGLRDSLKPAAAGAGTEGNGRAEDARRRDVRTVSQPQPASRAQGPRHAN
jgi:CRP/FNR family transcriptional regulator, cyclic AMP receptor protein